jgi:hypothetical protein
MTVFCCRVQWMLRLIAQKSTISPTRLQMLGFVVAQERQQALRLAGTRTQMNVRQENRTYSASSRTRIRAPGHFVAGLHEQGLDKTGVGSEIGRLQRGPSQ